MKKVFLSLAVVAMLASCGGAQQVEEQVKLYIMSLTLARSERVQNLLTHANLIELVFLT